VGPVLDPHNFHCRNHRLTEVLGEVLYITPKTSSGEEVAVLRLFSHLRLISTIACRMYSLEVVPQAYLLLHVTTMFKILPTSVSWGDTAHTANCIGRESSKINEDRRVWFTKKQ